jgi:type IV fimbrial biogenesis protein FimT
MKERGFTLVELMVAVTVALFLLISGMPIMNTYVGNVRLRAGSEGMLDGLAVARNEAIRRNTTVLYRYNGPEWFVVIPGASGAPDTTLVHRAESANSPLRVTPSAGQVAFSGSGRTFPAGTALAIQFSNPSAGACRINGGEVTCLRIDLPASGEPRLCDPAATPGSPKAC